MSKLKDLVLYFRPSRNVLVDQDGVVQGIDNQPLRVEIHPDERSPSPPSENPNEEPPVSEKKQPDAPSPAGGITMSVDELRSMLDEAIQKGRQQAEAEAEGKIKALESRFESFTRTVGLEARCREQAAAATARIPFPQAREQARSLYQAALYHKESGALPEGFDMAASVEKLVRSIPTAAFGEYVSARELDVDEGADLTNIAPDRDFEAVDPEQDGRRVDVDKVRALARGAGASDEIINKRLGGSGSGGKSPRR